MATTVGTSYLNLADLYKRQDPGGSIADVIEILAKMNPVLQDAVTVECNDGSKHLTTVRTGLPTGTWRKLYQGVQPTKSITARVIDTTGMYEAWSEIDAKLVDLAADKGQFRLDEGMAFVVGMSQDMESTIFYGDAVANPERFTGLHERFKTKSTDPTQSGYQIVDDGGTGSDLTSIWFVVWSPRTVHLLYPKGTKAGLQRDDKGMQTKTNSDGSIFDVYREKFSWDVGLSVRDYRYVARVANVENDSATVITSMSSGYHKLHQRRVAGGKAVVYMNKAAGMRPNKWLSALFGSAAALEIIHPDAYVGEEFGQFLVTRTPETAAQAAVHEAVLPEVIHIRGTQEELKTARVIGDLAIILKDSGTPTVVGMIMFFELCSIIQEGATIGAGRAGGPLVVPLHHWVTSPTLALYMLGRGATQDDICATIGKTHNQYFQSEHARLDKPPCAQGRLHRERARHGCHSQGH